MGIGGSMYRQVFSNKWLLLLKIVKEKEMSKIFCIGIVLFCLIVNAKAQKVDDDSLIDSIKSDITQFLIKENLLDGNKVKGSLDYVYATEIKQKRSIGYDDNGIYRIGVHQSHSPEYILIKQKNKFGVFDLKEIGMVLQEVINYSEKNNIDAEVMLAYVKEVMDIYQHNHKTGNSKVKKVQ